MSEDLDLRGIDSRYDPNPQFRAALRDRVAAIVEGADPDAVNEARDLVAVDLQFTNTPPAQSRNRRLVAQAILAAAAIVAIALVASRDDESAPADQPSPTVTVLPTTPQRPLSTAAPDPELLAPGTYFVDEVAGTPTPRISVTIGAGWSTSGHGSDLSKNRRRPPRRPEDMVGFIMFSRPDKVYLDACHLSDGFHPGPVTTLDGLVTALMEQKGGWVDVTAPTDISIDGHPGKTFQRTVPAVLSDCPNMTAGRMRLPELDGNAFRSWLNESEDDLGGWYYEPGQVETLIALDIDGSVVVINANLWVTASATERSEFADVLDSIRIDARPIPNRDSENPLPPGRYYVDEVSGTPTPRIYATIGAGWRDLCAECEGWGLVKLDTDAGLGALDVPQLQQLQIGHMVFSQPAAVFLDACHTNTGDTAIIDEAYDDLSYHRGPVTTLDGLVAALTEQKGWADVTAATDISIDGYAGKAFQRTAPADISGCDTMAGFFPRVRRGSAPYPVFVSWLSNEPSFENARYRFEGSGPYDPGEVETLWVIDIDGTLVVISTRAWPEPSAGATADFADDVLDSISIEHP